MTRHGRGPIMAERVSPLRAWREANGYSREHFALIIGISYQTVANWEVGRSGIGKFRDAVIDTVGIDVVLDHEDWYRNRERRFATTGS